jgi:hypothetical protein
MVITIIPSTVDILSNVINESKLSITLVPFLVTPLIVT